MKKINLTLCILLFILANFVRAQVKENVEALGNWDDKTIPPIGADPQRLNEVWGFSVGKNEYGVIGSTLGIHIIDVTDAKNPKLKVYIKGSSSGTHVVHRDFHDYNGYLYMVADEGPSKLQIADISKLPSTGEAPVVYESDELLITSHNIFVDSATKKLYACGVADKNESNGLEIYSLEDPANPKHLGAYNTDYVHDIYVKNDTAFLNCGGAGLKVMSFADVQNPQLLGKLESYPDKGYNHSGWTSEDGKYYFFADETAGMKLKSTDITDLTDIKTVATFGSGVDTKSMVHNLIVKGDFLYTSYYHDGFYVFNISDPGKPFVAGYYDTYEPDTHDGFYGAWGVYPFLPSGHILLSDMESGLWVFDVSKITTDVKTISNEKIDDVYIIGFNNGFKQISILNKFPTNSVLTLNILTTAGNLVDTEVLTIGGFEKKYINTTSLAKGLYIIRIANNSYAQTSKINVF